MSAITAKVKNTGKNMVASGETTLKFLPDYQDGRNKQWAKYTPALDFSLTVKNEVADLFELGGNYLVTFEPATD